jgi:hypothetical protein
MSSAREPIATGSNAPAPLQQKKPAAPVEAEVLDEENVRRSEPLHARTPAAKSEARAEATPRPSVKPLDWRDFGAFRKISEDFIADSLLHRRRRSS